jgi:hypothetical protein
MDNIDYVAWWGAIIATSVLLWDVVKWLRSGARLKYKILFNVHYDDGEILKKETTEYGENTIYEEYCHIELINTGSLPTTIMNICGTHKFKPKKMQLIVNKQVFTEHYGKKLPYILNPGEVWACRLPMHRYTSLFEYGEPEIHLSVSSKSKPLIIRAKKKVNNKIKLESKI